MVSCGMKLKVVDNTEVYAITFMVAELIVGMWAQFLPTDWEDSFTSIHIGDLLIRFEVPWLKQFWEVKCKGR